MISLSYSSESYFESAFSPYSVIGIKLNMNSLNLSASFRNSVFFFNFSISKTINDFFTKP
jgi:hypothetical protein